MKINAENNKYHGEIGWGSDIQLFAEVAVNPKQWLGTSAEHLYSAEIMLPHIKRREKLIEEAMKEQKSISLPPSLTGIYLLHCALSIENSIKSLISVQYIKQIRTEIKSSSKTPKILLGHDLVDLAKRINLPLDTDQEFTLKFLTRYGVWSGKYHQPIKNSDNDLTEELSDGNHYMTGGYNPKAIPTYFDFCLNFYHESREKVNKSSQGAQQTCSHA